MSILVVGFQQGFKTDGQSLRQWAPSATKFNSTFLEILSQFETSFMRNITRGLAGQELFTYNFKRGNSWM